MTIIWDYPLFSDNNPILAILILVLVTAGFGALFGSMAGLVQWAVLRSRSTAAFPARMILISAVAGAAGAIAQPLVNIGLLVIFNTIIKIIPPQVSFTLAAIISTAVMGAVYGGVMATSAPHRPSPNGGADADPSSEFFGSRPRLPWR